MPVPQLQQHDTANQAVSPLSRLTQPLGSPAGPCGPDLEHDNDMLELVLASQGKPETQFSAAVPPNWREVQRRAESLLERSRDLRTAMYWLRASIRLDGFVALPTGLGLLRQLLEQHWEHLHPLPDADDGDLFGRMNALALLNEPDGLLGDVRHAVLLRHRGMGELRVRSVEAALHLLSPRAGETVHGVDQLKQMLSEAAQADPSLALQPLIALQELDALERLLQHRAVDAAPDLQPLRRLLQAVASVMPTPTSAPLMPHPDGPAPDVQTLTIMTRDPALPPVAGAVRSRDDALRAIDLVCEYLERTEPTNPAPLFLRRAQRLISHSFLQLVKELAPDALAEVARVVGVDPETVAADAH